MNPLFEYLRQSVADLWKQVRQEGSIGGFLPLIRPVPPYDGPLALSPLTTIGVLLGLVITSGIALSALGVLLVALLALYFLMSEVLGLKIEIKPLPF